MVFCLSVQKSCAPQKVDPALIARFRAAMLGCFLSVDPTTPPMGASAVKCWRSLRNREREARTGVAEGWGLPSTNRQNEMVAVIEIVRGAPSQAAFSVMAER